MPRLQPRLFRRAAQLSPDLAILLPICRDLSSAQNELRWIQEYVRDPAQSGNSSTVRGLCRRRGRGEPLQYILGSQPFGSLDIKCRPGVLIPRPETEAYSCYVVDLVRSGRLPRRSPGDGVGSLSILDLCTGTGCIPLLLYSALQRRFSSLRVLGVDISPTAVDLARGNKKVNIENGQIGGSTPQQSLSIEQGDVFSDEFVDKLSDTQWDILISNPPYISANVWRSGLGQLGYSVRKHEPRLALVPGLDKTIPDGWRHEDVFYHRICQIAVKLKPRFILLEVGDEAQACRVLTQLMRGPLSQNASFEVWRDWPEDEATFGETQSISITHQSRQHEVVVRGSGQVRAITIERV